MSSDASAVVLAIREGLQDAHINRPYQCDWHERIEVKSGPINVVFFHVDYVDKHPFLSDRSAVDYTQVLKSSVFAARRARANSAVIVLTNEKTQIPIAGAQVIRLPVNPDQMMYSRMRAYRALAHRLSGPTLFLDTDVHLNKDFAPAFADEFDVGLTYRTNYAAMPYNEAVILGNPGAGLTNFFTQALGIYDWLADLPQIRELYSVDPKMWRGGQLSIAALLDWARPAAGIMDIKERGVRYRLLPCELYNYAVQGDERRKELSEKWALHYKGAAKARLKV